MMDSSPPRTPEDNNRVPDSTRSTPSSDESSLDVSFNYVVDDEGNLVRCSKGSSHSNGSSPPTPSDLHLPESPALSKPPSTEDFVSPSARRSLSRSEGGFPVLSNANVDNNAAHYTDRPARSFQRVASAPAPSYLAPTASSLAKPRTTARRVTMEDDRERVKPSASWSRQTLDPGAHALQEEKENISETDDHPYLPSTSSKQRNNSPPLVTRSTSSVAQSRFAQARATYLAGGSSSANSRPLTDLPSQRRDPHSRQVLPGPNRPGRIVKTSTSTTPASKYAASHLEGEASDQDRQNSPTITHTDGNDTDPDEDLPQPIVSSSGAPPLSSIRQRSQGALNIAVPPLSLSTSRPRRSASLSDAAHHDDYQLQVQQQFQNPSSRPGTSMSVHGTASGPRRVTQQEWDAQDAEAELNKKYRAQLEELDRLEQDQGARQSPSPTHQQHPSSRPTYAHKRRDSDTLRSHAPPLSATSIGSPTVMESVGHRDRSSPPPASTATAASKLHARSSPAGTSAVGARGRVSPLAKAADRERDRASPPGKGRLSPSSVSKLSKEVARHRRSPTAPEPVAIDAREREYEREKEKERERMERDLEKDKKHLSLQTGGGSSSAQYASSGPTSAIAGQQFNRHIVVNKKAYARLDMIGKGGSSRVFRVLSHLNELYAIKRVSLDKTDAETMSGYMNEIALLKRLEGNSRIIRLIDSEVKGGPSGSKGYLMLVMECGEIDFARLLQEQMREPLNMVWVAYYWQQMLQAVHVIHEEKIVHSDLKPANFVLVRGQLKLIDFGIANAIANDTTNIQRDHQIGTVNYMSPEAIELPDGMRRLKVGRPSDVWSLGCILYQMVYGSPPFQHLSVYQKMKAIPDLTHVIDFPEYSIPTAPSSRSSSVGGSSSSANPEPPKKLEHLKQKVRKDVIRTMQDCLCRTPKERATIPQLMNHGWLSGKEEVPEAPPPPPPAARPTLGPNESIIDPYYMQQLLKYGIQTGLAQARGEASPLSDTSLAQEAERLISELRAVQNFGPAAS